MMYETTYEELALELREEIAMKKYWRQKALDAEWRSGHFHKAALNMGKRLEWYREALKEARDLARIYYGHLKLATTPSSTHPVGGRGTCCGSNEGPLE